MKTVFQSVGIVGAGAMGRGIAQIAAQAGSTVLVFESQPGAAAGALAVRAPVGWLIFETGFAQGGAVRKLLADAGLREVETRRDLAGLERATLGRAAG